MITIKELEVEILKEQTKADGLGIYCQGALTALKDVVKLIDEGSEIEATKDFIKWIKSKIEGK